MSRYRHEYKYLIDARQEGILRIRAGGVAQKDSHTREDGSYFIRSLYFDDFGDSCLMDNLCGADPRSKFRIRYYNSDTGHIRLEKKSKCRGMCLKEACSISAEECKAFLSGEIPSFTEDTESMKKVLFTEIRLRGLMPKVIVSYERIPFIYSGGNVRITFDRKLSSSAELDRFLTGDYAQRPVLPCGHSILEVKWDEVMPRYIKEAMCIERLQQTAFSKYYMCRLLHQ